MLLRDVPDGNTEDIFTGRGTHTQQPELSPSPRPTFHTEIDSDMATHEEDNRLDDVWGDDGDNDANQSTFAAPSDMPRLQQEHETAGYRDGITAAKTTSVQAGFDEGYGLGATIGLRAGELLGVLEGLANAHMAAAAESKRLRCLLDEARRELSVQAVFGSEYWAEDGTWSYHVPGDDAGGEAVFADVAAAHPLLRKWDATVRAEAGRHRVNWDVLKEEAEEERKRGELHGHGHSVERKGEVKGVAAKGKPALEW